MTASLAIRQSSGCQHQPLLLMKGNLPINAENFHIYVYLKTMKQLKLTKQAANTILKNFYISDDSLDRHFPEKLQQNMIEDALYFAQKAIEVNLHLNLLDYELDFKGRKIISLGFDFFRQVDERHYYTLIRKYGSIKMCFISTLVTALLEKPEKYQEE